MLQEWRQLSDLSDVLFATVKDVPLGGGADGNALAIEVLPQAVVELRQTPQLEVGHGLPGPPDLRRVTDVARGVLGHLCGVVEWRVRETKTGGLYVVKLRGQGGACERMRRWRPWSSKLVAGRLWNPAGSIRSKC